MASPSLYQPSPRFFHCAAQIGEEAYLWGGRTQNFSASGRKTLQSEVEIFDVFHETWSKKNVNGAAPPGLFAGACTVVSETLYHFGGNDGHSWYNTLHSLDTVSLDWRALHVLTQNPADQPMPKTGCGLVTYADAASLILFAGYGVPHGPSQPGSRFVQNTSFSDGRGSTNELHLFNLTNGEWTSPTTTGERPPPCAFFSFTAINHHKAVMFGGAHCVQEGRRIVNDVYIIDFRSMVWTKLERSEGASWPVEHTSHAATCLNYGDDHPQLLVTGGLDKNLKTLNDAWMLDINTGRWSELTLPEGTQPRWGHTVTSYQTDQRRIHATTFGGCPADYDPSRSEDDDPKLADTTVMEFESVQSSSSGGTPTIEWVLKDVIGSQGLGTPERLKRLKEMRQRKTEHELPYLPPAAVAPGFPTQLPAIQLTLPHLYQSTTLPVYEPTFQYSPAQFPVPPTVPTLQQQYSSSGFQEMLQEQLPTIPPIEPSLPPYYAPSRPPLPAILPPEVQPVVSSTAAYHVEAYTVAAPFDQPSIFSGPLDTSWTTVSATSPYTTYTDTPPQESPLPKSASQTADIKPKVKQPSPKEEKPSLSDIKPKMEFSPKNDPEDGTIEAEIAVKLKQEFRDIETSGPIEELALENKVLRVIIMQRDEKIAEQAKQIAEQASKKDVYKAAGVIAGKRKQLEASEQGMVLKKQRLSDEASGESAVEVGSEDKPAGMDKMEVKNQQVQTEIVKTVEQHVQAGSTAKQQGYLRGVEVIDHITFIYTGKAQSFEWLNHGFKIHFPENALPSNVSECRVHVRASLRGQFQFPENVEQISGIYWIVSPYTFTKSATIEIQHCAPKADHLQHPSSLTFIIAKCTQEDLPYQFKILDGGVFSPNSRYGSIELTQFSGVGVAFQSLMQWLGLRSNQPEPDPRSYCARLYYSSIGVHSWEVYFTVTWDMELHIAAADAKYGEGATKLGPDQEVVFEEEQITLDIKADGEVLENGWTISPDTYPRITKSQVDRFVPGGRVPSCQLYVEWTGQQEQPVKLVHKVKLLGAKEPNNFFLMRPPPLQQKPQSPNRDTQQMSTSLTTENDSVQQSLGNKYAGLESEPKLSDLMNEVASKVSSKWKEISIQLGLTLNDQKYFMELTLGDPKQCFTFVFTIWKSRATRPYKWSTVIQALESPAVDEIRLAQELKTKLQS